MEKNDSTQPRWMRIIASRWWYSLVPLHVLVAWEQFIRLHYIIDAITLLLGVILFATPAYLYPLNHVARSWIFLAIGWLMLMLRQLYLVFDPSRPAWLDILLVAIYVPSLTLITRLFYTLPFQRRSRISLLIDCLSIGVALSVVAAHALQTTVSDVLFITGNAVVFFMIINIYQQARDQWRKQFIAAAKALVALIFSDCIWLYLELNGYPLIYAGPVYTWAWITFGRIALVAPNTIIDYNEEAVMYVHPAQDAIGTLILGLTSCYLVLHTQIEWVIFFIGIIVTIRVIDAYEHQRLQKALDHSRISEGQLRAYLQSIGHDLKTPIYTLGTYLERTNQTLASTQGTAKLQAMHDVLLRRVKLMLDVSRTMDNTLHLVSFTAHETAALIYAVWDYVYDQAAQPAITFKLVQPHDFELVIDREVFVRISENLLVNAVKALSTTPQASITWNIYLTPTHIIFDILDNGPGFEAPLLHTLNAASPANYASMSGLGLRGTQHLIGALGGSITFANADHGGAHITLAFLQDPSEAFKKVLI